MNKYHKTLVYLAVSVFTITIVIFIVIWSFCQGYNIGVLENPATDATVNRYFEIYGIPTTKDEQCRFYYIIYKDSTECAK